MITFPAVVTALLIPFASYHFDPKEPHEQFNPGIAVEADWLAFGAYRNSFGRTTVFVQGAVWSDWHPTIIGKVRTGVSIGLGTGYHYPVIGGFQLQGERWNITLVPKLPWDEWSSTTLGFSLRFPL